MRGAWVRLSKIQEGGVNEEFRETQKRPDGMEIVLADGVALLRALPDRSLDGIVTDPPWGSGPKIRGQDKWMELIAAVAAEAPRVLAPAGRLLLYIGVNRLAGAMHAMGQGLVYSGAVAVRRIPPLCRGYWCLGPDLVLVYGVGGFARPSVAIASGEMTMVSRRRPDTEHPCARNVDIMRRLIRQWFRPGERIFDPFGGSATTVVAAADLWVRATAAEIDPVMFRTAEHRLDIRTPNLFPEAK